MDGLCIQMASLFSLAISCGMRPCCGVHPLPALFVPCQRGVLPPNYLPAARVFSCESTASRWQCERSYSGDDSSPKCPKFRLTGGVTGPETPQPNPGALGPTSPTGQHRQPNRRLSAQLIRWGSFLPP
ncbi:hypothetical protein EDB85DRAFT_2031198 [Lactarius pseudohatsudake]|nr:hypothetical protein EDB85DRAFT_2031198 [Lactarius pseudohatsudake]